MGILYLGTPMLQEEPHVEDIQLELHEMKEYLEQDANISVCLEISQGKEDALDANMHDDMP